MVLATAVLVALTAASRSEVGRLLSDAAVRARDASAPAEIVTALDHTTFASIPARAVPASDRPVVSGGGKRAEGQRAPSLASTAGGAPRASVELVRDVPVDGSPTSVGPIALGLTRRGPPGSGVR